MRQVIAALNHVISFMSSPQAQQPHATLQGDLKQEENDKTLLLQALISSTILVLKSKTSFESELRVMLVGLLWKTYISQVPKSIIRTLVEQSET